jgi:hypothetical protein
VHLASKACIRKVKRAKQCLRLHVNRWTSRIDIHWLCGCVKDWFYAFVSVVSVAE